MVHNWFMLRGFLVAWLTLAVQGELLLHRPNMHMIMDREWLSIAVRTVTLAVPGVLLLKVVLCICRRHSTVFKNVFKRIHFELMS
jgi:hypothetical protein